ncbi:YbhB/YbcL family Raf kinase inhibitor-like protein [Microbacterium sp. YY-01]|uniref:YbhB/YbcL family Raf kinase inhibitor-like protein n=1 Tax=Microbacterium sp. YY-01 TaxID=3421634 RepID=UPI003D1666F4
MFSFDPYKELATLRDFPPLTLTSPDFSGDAALPVTAWSSDRGGADRHPALEWNTPPEGTRSFALSCFDPDAPTGSGYWHWAVFNLPADLRSLDAGDGTIESLPGGARVLRNEAGNRRFDGAAPPEGTGVHRYFFVVDALDVAELDVGDDATPAILGFHRHFHSLARGVLMGTADPTER